MWRGLHVQERGVGGDAAASSRRVLEDAFTRPRSPALGNGDQAGRSATQAHGFPPLPDYEATLEQRLPLGVSISCVVILAVCLSCYVSIIK